MNIEIKQIIEKAEAGDMKSQSFLASMYYQGTGRAKAKKIGISRDYQKAFYWTSKAAAQGHICLLYTSPSPRDQRGSRMPSSA